MDMNDCRCVRGHAVDLIEKFCDGGASSRHVARQQVVHNLWVFVICPDMQKHSLHPGLCVDPQ